jgi:hypothetical protein
VKISSTGLAAGRGTGIERGQAGCDRFKDPRTKGEERALSLALDIDESRCLELFDVMRERGRRDGQRGERLRATEGTARFCDLLQQFKAAWISEGLEDGGLTRAREWLVLRLLPRLCGF